VRVARDDREGGGFTAARGRPCDNDLGFFFETVISYGALDFASPLMFVNAREKTCDPTVRAKSSTRAETCTDWVRAYIRIPHSDRRISYDDLLHFFDI